ncbi:uncharacterized protein [Rutidosis leptorrhynchoides]|uniref:uncharacterized protein n=1 Tax=Rutidosis leptorrhynchoides TaxID=125765 RepID=UPI003A9A399C
MVLGPYSKQHGTLRNNLVPKKVQIFIWRVMLKRLAFKVELDKRGVDLHSVRCPICDDDLESVEHITLSCDRVKYVWVRIFKWWGANGFVCSNITELVSSKGPSTMTSAGESIWQALKWISLYLIWKNRNTLVFQGKSWNAPMILNEIQTKSFEWISLRSKGKKFDWLSWLSNPSVYFNFL